jgi:hypothetical protein
MTECDSAIRRIEQTPQLQSYRDLILYGCPEGDERWRWIATAPLPEVLAWVRSVRMGRPVASTDTVRG